MAPTPPTTGSFIEFPLRLVAEAQEVRLAEGIHIRPIDAATRARVLAIKDVVLDENGRLKSYVPMGLDWFGLVGPELDQYDQLYSSNFVASVPTLEAAVHLNFSLKLLGPSCSSLYIGHEEPQTKHFLSPPCYYGDSPLTIQESTVTTLSNLLTLRRSSKSRKLDLMAEMFLYAMSIAPRKESRFVELSIILEMLLLPMSSAELSYRFALRMARFMARHCGAEPSESFKLGQQIYKTRSRLVHTGRDDALTEIGPKIEETVRILLAKYLATPELFEHNALDELCLAS